MLCQQRPSAFDVLSWPTSLGGAGQDGEVGVPAKLGRAVQDAGLPSHEQGADPALLDRRKDSAYRVRDQATLRAPGTPARAFRSPSIAAAASGDTSRPIPNPPSLRRAPCYDTSSTGGTRQSRAGWCGWCSGMLDRLLRPGRRGQARSSARLSAPPPRCPASDGRRRPPARRPCDSRGCPRRCPGGPVRATGRDPGR